jgi:hypothetical protein
MHPSFGVPWPRLQRAAARLSELHASPRETGRVHALIFICGLQYLLTYRQTTRRRLSHYLDDGLREAVDHTLPALMSRCVDSPVELPQVERWVRQRSNQHLNKLVTGFNELRRSLPASTSRWLEGPASEANFLRLTFGMGVAARFAPDSHRFTLDLLDEPLALTRPVLDVVESFHWHPDWSLALAR